MKTGRRHLLRHGLSLGAAVLALPALASSRRALAALTDGPFYPPRAWREAQADGDADLTQVRQGGRTLVARGEHMALQAVVADTRGRLIDGADVEIWQCDTLQHYRHPDLPALPGRHDEGFQGWGMARSDRTGALLLRTIKPVPYPGRTPHIHVKLRHASFGEYTSQLFLAGDPANARDFLWRAVPAADRPALEMVLQPAAGDSTLRWVARHTLVVPG